MSTAKIFLSSTVFFLGSLLGGIQASKAETFYANDRMAPAWYGGLPDGFYSQTSGFYSEYGRYNSCVGEACSRGGFNCSFESDLTKVINLCRYSGSQCISVACDESGDCSTESGLQKIVQACQWVDGTCLRDACDASDSCGLDEELFKILRLCKAN